MGYTVHATLRLHGYTATRHFCGYGGAALRRHCRYYPVVSLVLVLCVPLLRFAQQALLKEHGLRLKERRKPTAQRRATRHHRAGKRHLGGVFLWCSGAPGTARHGTLVPALLWVRVSSV